MPRGWGGNVILFSFFIFANLAALSVQARELKIVSYNAWYVPLSNDYSGVRAKRFARELVKFDADIYLLQEIWSKKDKRAFAKDFAKLGYPYAHYRAPHRLILRGAYGNGLLTVSRFPIREPAALPQLDFSGYSGAEYLTVKGALHSQIQVPESGWIDVFNTHLQSTDFDSKIQDFDSDMVRVRFYQALSLIDHIKKIGPDKPVILGGDFNVHLRPWNSITRSYEKYGLSMEHALYRGQLNLTDSFHDIHGDDSPVVTCSADNFHRRKFRGVAPDEHLDYVFVRHNDQKLRVIDSRLILKDPLEGLSYQLSDHYGVMTTVDFR